MDIDSRHFWSKGNSPISCVFSLLKIIGDFTWQRIKAKTWYGHFLTFYFFFSNRLQAADPVKHWEERLEHLGRRDGFLNLRRRDGFWGQQGVSYIVVQVEESDCLKSWSEGHPIKVTLQGDHRIVTPVQFTWNVVSNTCVYTCVQFKGVLSRANKGDEKKESWKQDFYVHFRDYKLF